jgi:hypothetical protein
MKQGVKLEWHLDKMYSSELKRLAGAAGGGSGEMQKEECRMQNAEAKTCRETAETQKLRKAGGKRVEGQM